MRREGGQRSGLTIGRSPSRPPGRTRRAGAARGRRASSAPARLGWTARRGGRRTRSRTGARARRPGARGTLGRGGQRQCFSFLVYESNPPATERAKLLHLL